mmetsp:Transcript_38710/g.80401  ORF Transcript_38710/g.80401 Transcript_38710/m.80401 type:complete len:280 (-) Transcript_38710:340-1179(-)
MTLFHLLLTSFSHPIANMLNCGLSCNCVPMLFTASAAVNSQCVTVLAFCICQLTHFVVNIAQAFVSTSNFGMACPVNSTLDRENITKDVVCLSVFTFLRQDGTNTLQDRRNVWMVESIGVTIQSKSLSVEHHGRIQISSLVMNASHHHQSSGCGGISKSQGLVINSNSLLVAVHGLVEIRPFVKDTSNIVKNGSNLLVIRSTSVAYCQLVCFSIVLHRLIKFSFLDKDASHPSQNRRGDFSTNRRGIHGGRSEKCHGFFEESHGRIQVPHLGPNHANYF